MIEFNLALKVLHKNKFVYYCIICHYFKFCPLYGGFFMPDFRALILVIDTSMGVFYGNQNRSCKRTKRTK